MKEAKKMLALRHFSPRRTSLFVSKYLRLGRGWGGEEEDVTILEKIIHHYCCSSNLRFSLTLSLSFFDYCVKNPYKDFLKSSSLFKNLFPISRSIILIDSEPKAYRASRWDESERANTIENERPIIYGCLGVGTESRDGKEIDVRIESRVSVNA